MGGLFRDYWLRLRGFNRSIRFFLLTCFLSSTGLGMFMVIFNLYLKDLGYDEAFIGQTVALKSLAAVVILLPAGIISDLWGRKQVMAGGIMLTGLFIICLGWSKAALPLLVFNFLLGLFNSFYMVAFAPFMAENSHPEERIHLFSINSAIMLFSCMLGNILGGWIPDLLMAYGLSMVLSKRITILAAGTFNLLAMLTVSQVRVRHQKQIIALRQLYRMIKGKKDMELIFKFVVVQIIIGIGAGLMVPYFNLYFSSRFGLSPSLIGLIMAGGQVMTAAATLISPLLVNIMGKVRTVFVVQLLSLPFLLALGLTPWLSLAVLAYLLRGALMNSVNPVFSNLLMDSVNEEMKGIANSLIQMVFQLGWVICGPVSGWIIAHYGYSYIFFISAFFYLISAGYFYVSFKYKELRVPAGDHTHQSRIC